MLAIPLEEFRRAVNQDAEYRLVSRYWDSRLELAFGAQSYVLQISDGEVLDIASPRAESEFCDSSHITIRAPEADWLHFLEPIPRPFYQDLWGAQIHHDFSLEGDRLSLHAYYRAASRLLEVLRRVVAETASPTN